jgi:hypothetical protein
MFAFVAELLRRSSESLFAAMGTTLLGGVIVPIVFALARLSWLWRKKGRRAAKKEWKTTLRFGFFIALGIWLLIFCMELFYQVPRQIYADAEHAHPPRVIFPALPPPAFAHSKRHRAVPPVTIVPAQVTYGAIRAQAVNPLSDTYNFRISNNLNKDVYEVTFKLRVMSTSEAANDFVFHVEKASRKPLNESDPLGSTVGDIWGLDCIDIHRRTVLFRVIYHLSPREVREVGLTHINPDTGHDASTLSMPQHITIPNARVKGGIVVRSELSHFSTSPVPRLGRANLTAVGFYSDETFPSCGAAVVSLPK